MLRWRESGRAPPLTLPTEARRRRRRVEPPRILSPPWRRKREKLPGSLLPKHPHLCKLLFLRHCLFICLAPVLMHFARFRKKATTSLKKTSKLGASRTIKDMLHRDAYPSIAPTLPPSSLRLPRQAHKLRRNLALLPWKWTQVPLPRLLSSASRRRRRVPPTKWLNLRLRMPSVAVRRWWKQVLLSLAAPLHPRKP